MKRGLFETLVVPTHVRGSGRHSYAVPISLSMHAGAVLVLASLATPRSDARQEIPPKGQLVWPTVRVSETIHSPKAGSVRAVRPMPARRDASPRVDDRPSAVPVSTEAPPGIGDEPVNDTPRCLVNCGSGDGPPLPPGPDEKDRDGDGLGPVRVGGHVDPPRKLRHVEPAYPEIAKKARVQGVVSLECVIGVDGHVREIRVARGIALLDNAAVDAVRQWTYTPTRLNGATVEVLMTVTVHFTLSR